MPIQVKLKPSYHPKRNNYPLLMESKLSEGLIVLYCSERTGVVIASGMDSDFGKGEYRKDWVTDNFKDYEGEVILSNL